MSGWQKKIGAITLFVEDPDRSKAFYREVFGWGINSMPEMEYAMLQTTETDESGAVRTPGAINGGMLRRQGAITGPVITIGTEDIETTLAHGTVARRVAARSTNLRSVRSSSTSPRA